jgi:hypothetical protein
MPKIQFMKLILFLFMAVASYACNSGDRSAAIDLQNQITSIVEKTAAQNRAVDGATLRAKVNGSKWEGAVLISPEAAGRIVGENRDDEYLGLPYNDKNMVVGKKRQLGPDYAVDINFHEYEGLWLTQDGEMEVTAVGDKWAEGKFQCTLKKTDGNETVKITDGFFRIPAPNNR